MKPPSDMTPAELNAAMAVEVMGWDGIDNEMPVWINGRPIRTAGGEWVWSPTTDIAAAMNDVVGEMVKGGWHFALFKIPNEPGLAYLSRYPIHERGPTFDAGDAWSDSTPLARAICEVALAAKRTEG